MPSVLVETAAFEQQPEARRLHEAGLEASLGGHYEQSRAYYKDALAVLYGLANNPDIILQSARIIRDDGFNYVRQAMYEESETDLAQGQAIIGTSEALTGMLLKRAVQHPPYQDYRFSRRQVADLHSEHGATINVAARAITVAERLFGITDGPRRYEEARKHHLKGKNGYYLVSNDVTDARDAKLADNEDGVRQALRHAYSGVLWSKKNDPNNFKRAALTVVDKRLHMLTYGLAFSSMLRHP